MNSQEFKQWCASYCHTETFKKPLIMGVVNVTPDSFSDSGRFLDPHKALDHALQLIADGADIIDVGGESTRPGATPVATKEELHRVLPVIEQIRQHTSTCVSIDTSNPIVMQEAMACGASFINDIRALSVPGALKLAADLDVPICLMHMRGEPQTMQQAPYHKGDILALIHAFFKGKIEECMEAGIKKEHLMIDPGFGFGKSSEQNLRVVNHVSEFHLYQSPIVLGVSRKTTLGHILQKATHERCSAGLVAAVFAALQGVGMLRTHDVFETTQALTLLHAIKHETFFSDKLEVVLNLETRN